MTTNNTNAPAPAVHAGYTMDELRPAFDAIHAANWKDEINAEIRADGYCLANAAAEFYTGAGLSIRGRFKNADGVDMLAVHGPGYYRTIGA